jgi:hypothetical protein
MNDVFPAVSTVSLKDAEAGSIVRIMRSDGPKFALVADHFSNDTRSFVWLNPNFKDRPAAIFAEKWPIDSDVLQYRSNARFELGTANDDIDQRGRYSRKQLA